MSNKDRFFSDPDFNPLEVIERMRESGLTPAAIRARVGNVGPDGNNVRSTADDQSRRDGWINLGRARIGKLGTNEVPWQPRRNLPRK